MTKTTENDWITFKKEAKINPNTFFKDYAISLGLGQYYDFKPLKDETDKLQIRRQRYQLYFRNVPVERSEFSLHSANGEIHTAHVKMVEWLDIDVNKRIGEPKALDIALADKGLTTKNPL
ncbi:MAG: hypothetical protein R2822_25580 [Spirosomataceae bacterium]